MGLLISTDSGEELADRFGVLTESATRVLKWLQLKVRARESGIAYVGLNNGKLNIGLRYGKSSVCSLPETTGAAECNRSNHLQQPVYERG